MSQQLDAIFRPRSIAVIGASRKGTSIGRQILHNLISYEFEGPIFPVNPHADFIHSMKCYRSVADIPGEVDLAIICVPSPGVLPAVEECGQKGVKGLVVITAGFKETGEAGAAQEDKLLATVRQYGMRLVGPNCMGVLNTDPGVRMDGTFAPAVPREGNVAFLSQSGALGVAILEHAKRIGLGISMFASLGNKADVSGNDLLEYWGTDPNTDVILMYIEGFGNPRKFSRIARELSRRKPVVALKSGRTLQGARAASSHTGALASRDAATDALFEQCGVLRVTSIEELFDLGLAFSHLPLPKGKRVAILTNAGGPGIMATDALVGCGMELTELPEEVKTELRAHLAPEASVHNPIDMIAAAGPTEYRLALKLLLNCDAVDAILVIFVPPIITDPAEIAAVVVEAATGSDKPILSCLMGDENASRGVQILQGKRLPVYLWPESAARTLAAMATYQQWRSRPTGEEDAFEVDKAAATKIFKEVKKQKRTQLHHKEIQIVLKAYGFPAAASKVVHTIPEAVEFARSLRAPVVLKALSEKHSHKTEKGGVLLNLFGDLEIKGAYHEIQERYGADLDAVLVQEMVSGGKEIIQGMTQDPSFGPLLMFGLGGVFVETMRDVVFRLPPLNLYEAGEMIRSIRGLRFLQGVRGEQSVDLEYLAELLVRLSQLVVDFPEIVELDLNPLLAFKDRSRYCVVDARMSIG